MTKRMMMVAASALAAVAFAALPAVASAAPEVDFAKAGAHTFKGTFGEASLTAVGQEQIICTGENHVHGEWTSGTTGNISLTFTNCHPKETPGIACTTSGQAAGTIVVAQSVFHLKYITSDVATPGTMLVKKPGVLITPPTGGTFATFSCSFLINIKVTGNGIIGAVTAPTCGSTSASSTLSFTSNSTGVQTYQLVEGDATTYTLKSSLNGGAAVQASEDVPSSTTEFTEAGETGTLTCK